MSSPSPHESDAVLRFDVPNDVQEEPQPADEGRNEVRLHSLTPKYEPEKHATYFEAIKDALSWTGDETVRNLALTGSYGVGKSSILRQVATDNDLKAIQVSLSSLGFEQESTFKVRAASSAENVGDEQPNRLRETKTNQIQKAIVKQLLYTQMPQKMPGSRYKRTSAFRPAREVVVALGASVPIALAFFLLGWTAKLADLLTVRSDWAIAANAGVALTSAAFVYGVRYLTHNKLRIDSISAGAATIQLSATSDTYFDEYLDEIVYFFEVADHDVVIFEDIDRFEDAHIFETLRELNTILNTAKQLEGRVIRFLYAIKDSIFEELGTRAAREGFSEAGAAFGLSRDAATLELARANRTKFFDLVIPVVPFVTHQSARELLAEELGDLQHSISEDLVDLVAQFVPDMRLIKNIRNEFVIFRRQILGKSALQLTEDALFAMVLYKSTHLSDFEQIKLGDSSLDALYRDGRTLVANETARLNAETQVTRRRVRGGSALDERSKRFGDALDSYVDVVLGRFGTQLVGMQYDNQQLSASERRSPAFWTKFAASPKELTLTYRHPFQGYNASSALSIGEVELAVGETMDPKQWESVGLAEAENKIASNREDVEFLSRADLSDLVQRPDLKIRRTGRDPVSFADHTERLLGSRLAFALVEQGYIDRYFTLYTSTFVGTRVNANAMNFILKNVDTGTADFHFPLTTDEARAVLHERPRLALREESAYNFDLLDYVLEHDAAGGATVLRNICRNRDVEKRFLQAYLASERDFGSLLFGLAGIWRDVLTYLVSEVDVDDERRLRVVDAALAGLSDDLEYAVNDEVARYLGANHLSLRAFVQPLSAAAARRVGTVIGAANLLIPDLSPLNGEARDAMVAAKRFEVTRSNLLIAIRPSVDLSLDSIKGASEPAYRRALSDVKRYLDALEDNEATVSDPTAFVPIVEDVARADGASLGAVIRRSSGDCQVSALDGIDASTWRALASDGRFPAYFANVAAYAEQFGIDGDIAVVLSAGSIAVSQDLEEAPKLELAGKLLGSVDAIPAPDRRASLLQSLKIPHYLAAEEIPAEQGEWIGELIKRKIIKDDADSFAVILDDDWNGLEYAITVSDEFASFVSPEVLPSALVPQFLASPKVNEALKAAVVERFEEFAGGSDREVVARMAAYALDHSVAVAWQAVQLVASARVGSSTTLRLLKRFQTSVTLEHLRPILTALGGEYPTLLSRNGRHPKFPDTPEVAALLQRMKALGTVNSVAPAGSMLKANMKKA